MAVDIDVDDPRREDVRLLLERHWTFASENSPPGHCHTLDVDELLSPPVTFFSARDDGRLIGVGALKELDAEHGELKSMHIAEEARTQGAGRALVDHLLNVARRRGYSRVSLETGTGDPFAPAQGLYAAAGFTVCGPFGEYMSTLHSVYMTKTLD